MFYYAFLFAPQGYPGIFNIPVICNSCANGFMQMRVSGGGKLVCIVGKLNLEDSRKVSKCGGNLLFSFP